MNSIEKAKQELYKLKGRSRFETMTEATSIITSLLESYNITPVVVGRVSR